MGNGASCSANDIMVDTENAEELAGLVQKLMEMIRSDECCVRYCQPILEKSPPGAEDVQGWIDHRRKLYETAQKYMAIIAANGDKVPETIEEVVASQAESGDINLSSADRDDNEVAGLLFVFQLERLTEIPASVLALGDKVTNLSIKKNSLKQLPDGIADLKNLTSLDISENEITALPECIGTLENLEEFNISENLIEELPAAIGGLKKLTTFIAFKNKLTKLPDEIGQCESLEEVNFFNNKLIKVPDTFSSLENLVDLNLGGNKLKTCPSTRKWANLERLALSWNTIVMLNDFGGMPKLRQLQLNRNQLSELPDDCLEGCVELEVVDLSTNRFEKLPPSLGSCTALSTLDVTGNELKSPLVNLGGCTSLKILKLGNNKLTDVTEANLGKCSELETLFLCGNQLTTLSSDLEQLTNMKRMNIADNKTLERNAEVSRIIDVLSERCKANKGRWIE